MMRIALLALLHRVRVRIYGLRDRLGRTRLWGLAHPQWWLKQRLAGKGRRYYGAGGTIHQGTALDVETRNGVVVSVWFRCQMLSFQQHEVDETRAREMTNARLRGSCDEITGVEVVDQPRIEPDKPWARA